MSRLPEIPLDDCEPSFMDQKQVNIGKGLRRDGLYTAEGKENDVVVIELKGELV